MKADEVLDRMKNFKRDLEEHRDLYGKSLDRIIPDYPIRNHETLRKQEEELTGQLYVLDGYLSKFGKHRMMYQPATGISWDVYTEAVGDSVAQIKGESLDKAVLELSGIIGLLKTMSPDDEIILEAPKQMEVSKSTKFGDVTIQAENVHLGDGHIVNLKIRTVEDFLKGVERHIEQEVSDPEERKNILTKLKEFTAHPVVANIISKIPIAKILEFFSG